MEWDDGSVLGPSEKSVTDNIEARLRERLKGYAFQPRPTYLKTPGNKWRASSAMQKAIRRGQTETAIRMANAIHGLEPDYVWRRLCTVVMEDVGVGNVSLVAEFLWIAGKKKLREELGDRKLLYMLIEEMCASVKDRHACDLLVLADLAPNLEESRRVFAKLPFEKLAMVAADQNAEMGQRMLAGWYMSGTKTFPSAQLVSDVKGDFPRYVLFMKDSIGFPTAIEFIMRWGRTRQYEGMPMAFPLAWQLVKRSIWLSEAPDDLVSLPRIGNYPSETFDQHNQEGKRAISYFVKACEPVRAWLSEFCDPNVDKETVQWAIGALEFCIEGHQVDRRLDYEGAMLLLAEARRAHMLGNRIPKEHLEEGVKVFRANLPMLHYARKKIVAPQLIQSGEKPEPVWSE